MKGSTIAAFIEWFSSQGNAERLLEIVNGLPAEQRELFDVETGQVHVLASRWYPTAAIHAVLDELSKGMSAEQRREFANEAGEGTTQLLRRGVYKLLLDHLLTPGGYARIVSTLWKTNYDSGRVENESLGPRRQRGTVHDWASHNPFLCELNVAVKASLFRAMGCKDVEVEARYCIDQGHEHCGSIIRWR